MGLFAKLTGKSTAGTKTTASQPQNTKEEYRGVEVVSHGGQCCQAAQAIVGQRFLTDEAPMLPLKGCDAAECKCSYRRFGDRRTDMRRASDVGFSMASTLHDDENRSNASKGRRNED
jgi:hypothetical protein